MSEEIEYEISEVRVEDDNVLLVLTREDDGFGVTIPYSQFTTMTDEELDTFLEEQVKLRVEMLEKIKMQKESDKKKLKNVEYVKGKKIKLRKAKKGGEQM